MHGCERALVCGNHMWRWERQTKHDLRYGGFVECGRCLRQFSSFDDTARIAAI
jgi:hypothetical protein